MLTLRVAKSEESVAYLLRFGKSKLLRKGINVGFSWCRDIMHERFGSRFRLIYAS